MVRNQFLCFKLLLEFLIKVCLCLFLCLKELVHFINIIKIKKEKG